MATPNQIQSLTKAFQGVGVDENTLITIMGKWQPGEANTFRKESNFFEKDTQHLIYLWKQGDVIRIKKEFLLFKNAVILWMMHPWERDARLLKKAINDGPQSYNVLVEIACTRSSDQLLGARKAYHSLFDSSIEEDTSSQVKSNERKFLVCLVSVYRYEGTMVNNEVATFDALALVDAITSEIRNQIDVLRRGLHGGKNVEGEKSLLDNDDVLKILTTRSKRHLMAVCEVYKRYARRNLDEDFEDPKYTRLKETIQCLCAPQKYFTKVLDTALKNGVNTRVNKALTRVIVTRTDIDMKKIKEEFQNQYGVELSKKIEEIANGNYKDFLLTLVKRGN
ncbi:annexin D4-like [Humulus lupulus]|uniref:annexin D4-like n=1 Tax=Humulus lupulus TaxID=3486 RepID=UPI002B415524|nr:annexin D4-like [Humulus lupulus]